MGGVQAMLLEFAIDEMFAADIDLYEGCCCLEDMAFELVAAS